MKRLAVVLALIFVFIWGYDFAVVCLAPTGIAPGMPAVIAHTASAVGMLFPALGTFAARIVAGKVRG